MGISSSKSTTKTNATETASKTPTNPPWATDAIQAQTGRITDFMNLDPQSLVAGPSALQTKAFGDVQNLGGWQAGNQTAQDMAMTAGNTPAPQATSQGYNAPQLGAAAQVDQTTLAPTAHAESQSLLDGLSNYVDPYINDVVDSSLRNYDYQTGASRAAMQAEQARTGAFGGSRSGIQTGTFDALSDMNRAGTEAGLRSDAFRFGAGLSGQDADRRQNISIFNTGSDNTRNLTQGQMDQNRLITNAGFNNQRAETQGGFDASAAQFGADAANRTSMFNTQVQSDALQRQLQAAGLVGDLSDSQASNSLADLGMTANLGGIQQQIAQAQAMAPAMQLELGTQALGTLPYGLFSGYNATGTTQGTNVTKSSPSLFSSLLGGASNVASGIAAGGGFSDRRLKRDIEEVGQHGKLKLYNYNYHWDAPDRAKRTGVMVDEVAKYTPDALGPVVAGYGTVNYERLGLAHLVEGE